MDITATVPATSEAYAKLRVAQNQLQTARGLTTDAMSAKDVLGPIMGAQQSIVGAQHVVTSLDPGLAADLTKDVARLTAVAVLASTAGASVILSEGRKPYDRAVLVRQIDTAASHVVRAIELLGDAMPAAG